MNPATELTYHDYQLLSDDGKRGLEYETFRRASFTIRPSHANSHFLPDLTLTLAWILK